MRCVICGENKPGVKYKFPDTFVQFSSLVSGSVVCNDCIKFLKDQTYRRRSWIIIDDKVEFLDKKKALQYLLNPPDKPFVFYITKTGKKQGFLRVLRRKNYSRNRFIVAFDDSIVFVDINDAMRFYEIIKDARRKGFSKSELLGNIKLKNYKHEEICEEIIKNKDNPLWKLLVYLVD